MRQLILITTMLATFPIPAYAQQSAINHSAQHFAQVQAASLTDGEVRKVDTDARKITIKHGPILNLDMPGMTMVFQVKEPVMLDKVKTGDKIKFRAEITGGNYIVTHIEPAK